jgi:type II protein arginine methyltransferase
MQLVQVSELLGSFGDNELSPECLDGAQRLLQENGICIPSRCTSYLAPVSCHAVHSSLRAMPEKTRLETPVVVKLCKHRLLAAPQPVFAFEHPNKCAAAIDF